MKQTKSILLTMFFFWLESLHRQEAWGISLESNEIAGSREERKNLIIKQKIILLTTTTTISPNNISTLVPITTMPNNQTNSTPIVVNIGIGCGVIQLHPYDLVRVQSNNFGVGNYFNNDACTWKFLASDCIISAECPCFNVPASFDCIEDYLKIVDLPYHQKFCGSTQPDGLYFASSKTFTIRFRSNKRTTGKGFACYVQCTPPGFAAQNTSTSAIACPDGF